MSLSIMDDKQIADFHTAIELPWRKSFLSLMRSTFLEGLVDETDISFSKRNNDFVRKNWKKIKHLTLVDPFRMGVLIDLLEKVANVEGDIVECGSYKGGSGILMALWLRENGINKKIHMMDSFAGLPDPDKVNDKGYKKGQFVSDFDLVKAEIEKNDLTDFFEIHRGWFSETVPPLKSKINNIALFHVDCDLYTSTNDCFPDLYPLVSEGGAIVLDDFNDGGGGEKKAVHEYFERNGISEIIQISPAPQSYIIKGQLGTSIKVDTQNYSYQNIEGNKPYLNWLIENYDLNLIENINEIETIHS